MHRRDGGTGVQGERNPDLLRSPTLSPSPQPPLSFPKTSREFYPANVRFFTAHSFHRQSPGLKIILTPAAPPEREFHLYVHPLVLRIFHRNFPEPQTPVKFDGRLQNGVAFKKKRASLRASSPPQSPPRRAFSLSRARAIPERRQAWRARTNLPNPRAFEARTRLRAPL